MTVHGFININVEHLQDATRLNEYISKYAVKVAERRNYQRMYNTFTWQAPYAVCVMLRRQLKEKFPTFGYEVGVRQEVKVNDNYTPFERNIVTGYLNGQSVESLAVRLKVTAHIINSVIADVSWRSGKRLTPKVIKKVKAALHES